MSTVSFSSTLQPTTATTTATSSSLLSSSYKRHAQAVVELLRLIAWLWVGRCRIEAQLVRWLIKRIWWSAVGGLVVLYQLAWWLVHWQSAMWLATYDASVEERIPSLVHAAYRAHAMATRLCFSRAPSFGYAMQHALADAAHLYFSHAGGVMVKVVQLVAPQLHRYAPHTYDVLKQFCDEVTPMSARDLARVLSPTYVAQTFVFFDPVALKAGHVGQAHRARLYDAQVGKEVDVIVKVKRYGIDDRIQAQLLCVGWMIHFIEWARIPVLSHLGFKRRLPLLTRMLIQQLDYELERTETEWFAATFAAHPTIRIPRVYGAACTSNCLVLEFLDGVPLHRMTPQDHVAFRAHRPLRRAMVAFVCRTSYILRHFQADPHPGNILYLRGENKIGLLDFGLTGTMSEEEAVIEKAFLCAVVNRKWDDAARVMTDHLYELRADLPSLDPITRAKLLTRAADIVQRTLGSTCARFQDFALEIVPLYLDHGYEPSTCFTIFELTLVSAEGSLHIAFPDESVWDMFREIGSEVGLPFLAPDTASDEEKARKQAHVNAIEKMNAGMKRAKEAAAAAAAATAATTKST
jgi:predicted unusual protein kinase regulating ubiquinone biosynthesis (AarF/ABC1/UbiB family)